MRPLIVLVRGILLGCLPAGMAWSQQPPAPAQTSSPARQLPRPDQLEPGVETSSTRPVQEAAPSGSQRQGNAAAKPTGVSPVDIAGGADASADKALAQQRGAVPGRVPKAGAGGKAQDRLELDTTQITGNRELPKVLYIVPWKRSDLGDLVDKPVNSLLDEVLAPVDRDVFKRENRYYNALQPEAGKASAPGK